MNRAAFAGVGAVLQTIKAIPSPRRVKTIPSHGGTTPYQAPKRFSRAVMASAGETFLSAARTSR